MNTEDVVKSICLAMIAIAKSANDTVFTPFGNDRRVFKSPNGDTMCETLAESLSELGVMDDYIAYFFDIQINKADINTDDEYIYWIRMCIDNPNI